MQALSHLIERCCLELKRDWKNILYSASMWMAVGSALLSVVWPVFLLPFAILLCAFFSPVLYLFVSVVGRTLWAYRSSETWRELRTHVWYLPETRKSVLHLILLGGAALLALWAIFSIVEWAVMHGYH
jgi:hypothetical protein